MKRCHAVKDGYRCNKEKGHKGSHQSDSSEPGLMVVWFDEENDFNGCPKDITDLRRHERRKAGISFRETLESFRLFIDKISK